jgi:hypothetical protein
MLAAPVKLRVSSNVLVATAAAGATAVPEEALAAVALVGVGKLCVAGAAAGGPTLVPVQLKFCINF